MSERTGTDVKRHNLFRGPLCSIVVASEVAQAGPADMARNTATMARITATNVIIFLIFFFLSSIQESIRLCRCAFRNRQ